MQDVYKRQADGIQNGGLAHGVHADHIGEPCAVEGDIFKVVPDVYKRQTRDPHTLAVGFLLRLRRTGWLEEQPGSYGVYFALFGFAAIFLFSSYNRCV